MYDDIAAISTPPGEGGIAIIRLSGSGVIDKASQIFSPRRNDIDIRSKEGYSLTLGWIIDADGETIDEVLLALMRAPRSYTGEDVIEIHCHGGILPVFALRNQVSLPAGHFLTVVWMLVRQRRLLK